MSLNIVKEEEVRGAGKRRILYGWICTLDTGEKIYLAKRKHAEIFRSGRTSISEAMAEHAASWAIDEIMLFNLRAKGVTKIGVRVIDTGDLYLTDLATYFDRKKFKLRDYTGVGRGGSRQRYVPLEHFDLTKGVVDLSESM